MLFYHAVTKTGTCRSRPRNAASYTRAAATPVVNDAPTLFNRIFGTLTAIGGIAEAAVGGIGLIAGIGSANPLLIGGGVVGLNGIECPSRNASNH